MLGPSELAVEYTDLDDVDLNHLQRLMGSWGMLADLSFSDLLLLVPTSEGHGSRFVVLGQMRPSTGQTLHHNDLVGQLVSEAESPLVARAWELGQIVVGERTVSSGPDGVAPASRGERAQVECIPLRWQSRLVGIISRESPLAVGRRPGELERVYVDVFARFACMMTEGLFPFEQDEAASGEALRVGDGVLVLDAGQRVSYASPNAVNALHRMGVNTNAVGLRFDELGIDLGAVTRSFAEGLPVLEEVERRLEVIVLIRCIPLILGGRITGGLVVMRDVTDLRRRDRLLVSKDATIREVHHRVKNNLQTISSLLSLQARRLGPGEGRTALREAERRIRSIAVVHEILSRETGDQVPFDDAVTSLVRMAKDAVVSNRPVTFEVSGDAGELPADVATPLAVVLAELLQNAVEHAFGGLDDTEASPPTAESAAPGAPDQVRVRLDNDGHDLRVSVSDNGRGLPADFAIQETFSLGLSIVRGLVEGQMGGSIKMRNDHGTVVELVIPVGT
ncbi:MAG: sensor histidine kinase [Acidimicrobiales bacterium]